MNEATTSEQIINELDNEVKSASKNPFTSKFTAPLRLCVQWAKGINRRVAAIEKALNIEVVDDEQQESC